MLKPVTAKTLAVLVWLLLPGWGLAAAQQADSAQIVRYLDKARSVWYSDPNSARKLIESAIELGKQSDFQPLMAKSYNYLGIVYDIKDEYDSAMICYNEAVPLARMLNDTVTEASAYNNIGLIEWNTGHFNRAVANYFRALELFELLNKESGIANALNNIGLIYWEQERFGRATEYIKRSLTLREKLGDDYGRSAAYANLGLIYSEVDKLDSAGHFLQLAVKLKRPLNDLKGLAIAYSNLAFVYYDKQLLDSSIAYLQRSIALHEQLDDKRYLASNYGSLGWHYYENNQPELADEMLATGLALAEEAAALKEMYSINNRLANIRNEQGNYREAAEYYRTSLLLYDSIYDASKEQAIIEIQEKYETVQNEKELAMQRAQLEVSALKIKNKNYLVYGLMAVLGFLGMLAVILYRQDKFRQARLHKESQLKDKIAEVQLANRLNEQKIAISRDLHDNIGAQLTLITSLVDSMIYTLKNADLSVSRGLQDVSDYAHNTIRHLRDTVWAMKKEEISGQDLISRLQQFIGQADKASTGANMRLEVTGDNALQLSSLAGINLYRMVQEAINNAIKHASANSIYVQLVNYRGELTITVTDDGRGFDIEHVKNEDGLSALYSRASDINAKLQVRSASDQGTQVVIVYPEK